MTALTQWNPFPQVGGLQDRLSSFSDCLPLRNGHQSPTHNEWAPLVDVIETSDEYLIRADLPGASKSDINVTLEGRELTIKAMRETEPLAKDAQYVCNERPYGTFLRTFVLPAWAEASSIRAVAKHGVLSVKVQKTEQAKPRAIAIQGD